VDAIHIGTGIPGAIIGAGFGMAPQASQLHHLLLELQHVENGELLLPSVSLEAGAGVSAGVL
jgi:hypothetical protein